MSEESTYGFPEFARLARRLRDRLDEIVEAMLERVWANPALEEWTRADTRDAAGEIARASIARELEALEAGRLPDDCPEEDLATARAAVAYGAPVTVPLHCYRAGQAALQDAWIDEVERLELDPGERRVLLDAGSRFFTEYVDRCSAWVEREHMSERERLIRSEEQRRMNLVRDLLDGVPADAGALGYALEREHIAAIVWGSRADETAADLAGDGGLVLSIDPLTSWVWMPIGAADFVFDGPVLPGTRIALGGPAAGPDGFRRAHADARAAARVAEHRAEHVIHYRDVALEALAAQDEQRGRDFVEHELGPLLRDGARAETLLATLEAYFAAGQNAVSAAAMLGVHDRTVANRLHTVEETLGSGAIVARRAEIETALRLRRLLTA